MGFKFEIEGDWDDEAQSYDKPRQKPVRLDDSKPSPREAQGADHPVPLPASSRLDASRDVPDLDARLKTIEATLTDVMRRLKALETRAVGDA